jgi:hypothetical protein
MPVRRHIRAFTASAHLPHLRVYRSGSKKCGADYSVSTAVLPYQLLYGNAKEPQKESCAEIEALYDQIVFEKAFVAFFIRQSLQPKVDENDR